LIEIEYASEFKRNLRQLSHRYRSIRSDIEPLIDRLKAGETPGDQISGVGHVLYKVRLKNSDVQRGKGGGYRVIYYLKTAARITLITLYSKSDQGDVDKRKLLHILKEMQ
jgi:mRNA-degrading endonuclease RelE of RelBE toxin-antitoxin system